MKRRYILLLLALIVPITVSANSRIILEPTYKESNLIEMPKKIKIIYDSWNECKAQGDILKSNILLELAPEQEIDLKSEYTCIYAERIGNTKKFIATYEQNLEKSYVEKYCSETRVTFDSWDECKKQGDIVKGIVLHRFNLAEKIDLQANYCMIEAKRIKGTDKFTATYKLEK